MATLNRAFRVKNGLNVELGELRPAAGTTSYPPILFTSGTNLTTATAGSFEFDGTRFYLTPSTTRKAIALTDVTGVTLDSTITGSSLTSVGTLTNLTVTNTISGSISGNAGTVTNGVVTTGSYANPTWITELAWSKISGEPTTLAGYGITDAASSTHVHGNITNGGSIGSTADQVVVTGASGILTTSASPIINTINASAVSSAVSLYPTITTGSIAIGAGITTGTVDIATSTSGGSSRTVNINTGASGTGAIITNIGSATLGGLVTLNLGATGLVLNGSSSGTVVASPATSGSASNPVIFRSGAATSAASGSVTIQSGSTTTSGATGNVVIDTGTSAGTNGTIFIGGTNAAAVELGRSGQTTVIKGNLQIDGTTTTVNSTTLTVDDKNIVLGNDNTTDAQADGGGITLNGTTAKTFMWADTGDNWASSENLSLAAGKTYKIANADVISGTAAALVVGAGASTTIAIGANGGTATILNPTVTLTNATALNMNGSSPTIATTSTGTASVFNTTTTTVNLGGQSTTLNLGTGTFSTLRTINIGSSSSGTGNAQTINLGVNSTTTATSLINIGGSTSTTTTITGTVKLPTVGTSGFVKLGAGGELSPDTNTYVTAASPALTGTPTINSIAGLVTASGSTTGTTALTLSTVYASGTYNGGEFIIKATNSTNIEITKVLVITNGTDVYITTYGDVFVSANLVEIDFTYTGANVNMVITPVAGTTGTTTVKVTGTLVAV